MSDDDTFGALWAEVCDNGLHRDQDLRLKVPQGLLPNDFPDSPAGEVLRALKTV